MSTIALHIAKTASVVVAVAARARAAMPEIRWEPVIRSGMAMVERALGRAVLNGHAGKVTPFASYQKIKREVKKVDTSAWDPEPNPQMEASRCRALLLEVVRRAAHDWVLYRQHDRLVHKQLAEEAYIWLFDEEPGHTNWRERTSSGKMITAFMVICESLDLDPEVVRTRVRKMDVKTILAAGRPAERRKNSSAMDEVHYDEHSASADVDLPTFGDRPEYSYYENQYATVTPDYL